MTSRQQNKNASSFNPFDASSGDQRSIDEIEKQRKKEKQNFYRDQLDQLVHTNQHKKNNERNNNDNTSNLPQNSLNIGGRREPEIKYRQPQASEQKRTPQDAYPSTQQRVSNDYEQYQQQASYDNRPNPNINYNDYEGYYGQQELRQPQGGYSDPNNQPSRGQEEGSTFSLQDQQREQLLSKMRNGYKPQNEDVLNTYKRVQESQERSRQETEANIIEKVAKEKLQREEEQAMNKWDQKKRVSSVLRLQREMLLSNQEQIRQKENQKKREQQQEKNADKQRIQDSLYQFEQSNHQQKEKSRRLIEENNKQIQQQRQDYDVRNQKKNQEQDQVASKYNPNQDSIDQLYREQSQHGNNGVAPSRILAPKTNQEYDAEEYYYQQQQQQQQRQYEKPQQYSDYEYVNGGIEDLNLRDRNNEGPNSLQQGGYPPSQQGYAPPSRQQSQANSVASSSKSDYQKIKDRLKGSSFNIITGN